MKVSVIIPCYNAGAYLGDCLDSVLAQDELDFEVIVIDDGSIDNTWDVAKEYAKRDARIRVLHQENRGVSAARNLGLSAAKGEWITFVDGDDLVAPDMLSVMLSAADEQTDMVVCAHETFGETQECFWPQTQWYRLRGEKRRRAAALRLIEGDSILNIMCNKLHRRELLEREGIRLAEGVAIAEDALFNLEAVLCGNGIAYVNRVTYRYRIHSQSATQKRTKSEFEAHKRWFSAMRAMLERRGAMERYYAAFLDSVVLRLYKDGGIPCVIREFGEKAKPFLLRGQMDPACMNTVSKALLWLCETGVYICVYPVIAITQMIGRKISAAAWRLRARKEKPQ